MPNHAVSIMARQAPRRHVPRGFTLVELIAVMLVGGIIAAFAVPRFFQQESFDARSFTDQNLSMLRYGQKLAIAQNRPVFVLLNGSSIALCFKAACGAADRVLPPAGANSGSRATLSACGKVSAWLCEGAPNNITYAVPPVGAGFYFNALGRPFLAGDSEPVSTFPARLNIGISGAGIARTIVVEGETGYVHP